MSGLFELLEFTTSDDYSFTVNARDRGALAGRRTSLKVLKDGQLTPDMVSRMRDEARVLSRLRHPSMVHLFNLHSYRGRPVLEMEFLRGLSSAELISTHPNGLPAEVAIKVARGVSGALDAAYNRPVGPSDQPMRIVHRNVSLPNILVTVGGAVKLIDFIMAKGSFTDRMAISFVAPATARGYPAPELAENSARATEEVDVYSLGHVLHHLLTGTRMNLIGVEESHERDAASHLDNLVIGDLPADLAQRVITLVRRMISFQPTKRPTHREVVSELSDIIKHAGFGADLARFAEDVVAPQYADRELVPPSHHAQWREASFLEEQQPDIPDLDAAITPAIAEQRMRDIVKNNGWSKRIGEIQDLVIASGYRPDEPFLPVLDKALSPSWKFWERSPEADDICAALAMVVQSGSPEVLARARALLQHGSTDVRRAAEFVVAQYEDM